MTHQAEHRRAKLADVNQQLASHYGLLAAAPSGSDSVLCGCENGAHYQSDGLWKTDMNMMSKKIKKGAIKQTRSIPGVNSGGAEQSRIVFYREVEHRVNNISR